MSEKLDPYKQKDDGFSFGCLIFYILPFGFMLFKVFSNGDLKYFMPFFYLVGGAIGVTFTLVLLFKIVGDKHKHTVVSGFFFLIFLVTIYLIFFTDSHLDPEDLWQRPMKGR